MAQEKAQATAQAMTFWRHDTLHRGWYWRRKASTVQTFAASIGVYVQWGIPPSGELDVPPRGAHHHLPTFLGALTPPPPVSLTPSTLGHWRSPVLICSESLSARFPTWEAHRLLNISSAAPSYSPFASSARVFLNPITPAVPRL